MKSKLKILEYMIKREVRKQLNEETNLSQSGIKELKDGLTIEMIKEKYSWILKAKIKDAVLGQDNEGLVWYSGTWHGGTWKNGTWNNGWWKNGTWKAGLWKRGVWSTGTWYDGTWLNGLWWDGIWYGGTWEDGVWQSGLWKNGTWNSSKPHPNER